MAWTKLECCRCMRRIIEYYDVDDRAQWHDYINKCDGSCRTGKQTEYERVDHETTD
jgi:hypothetical protein